VCYDQVTGFFLFSSFIVIVVMTIIIITTTTPTNIATTTTASTTTIFFIHSIAHPIIMIINIRNQPAPLPPTHPSFTSSQAAFLLSENMTARLTTLLL
jgi:hypothetical protein